MENSLENHLSYLEDKIEEFHIENEFINDIKKEINNGLTNEMSEKEVYEFIAKTCANYISKDPDFNRLATHYEVLNLRMQINDTYFNLVYKQYNLGLLSDKFFLFVELNHKKIEEIIDNNRDELIDFFGLKTLQRSYLLKDKDGVFIENPQMMWMRCAIQVHGLTEEYDLEKKLLLIKETYDYMSNLYFTHATPTLFNSGSKYPQLSSCYLMQCPDDLSQISHSIGNMMKISKWAGGIGVNLSEIRGNGALIKSNGGHSSGIIPLCKVIESVARYINQCFSKDTIVYSKRGAITVETVKVDDELITKDGSFQKVLGISAKEVNKELLKIRVNHSFEPCLVTEEHQIYALINQKKILNYSTIKNRLDKNLVEPLYISASDLKEGDFIGFPIPTMINDVEYNEDFFRMYGIILGDGHSTKKKGNNVEQGVSLGTETKQDTYNFVIDYLTRKQIHHWISRNDEKHTVIIRWSQNAEKLPILYDDIYDESKNKIIKDKYLHLPETKTLALLKGLMETDGHNDKELYFNTSSKPLAFAVRYLYLRLGILTSGHIRPSGDSHEIRPGEIIVTKKDGYVLRVPKHPKLQSIYGDTVQYSTRMKFFEYNNILWSRVRNIEKEHYNGIVYDFNMENNHNYMTDMGLVHNSGKRSGSIANFLEPWHFDIYDFIDLRKNTGDENLRARDLFLGLWVPNAFMRAVEKGDDWYLMTPDVSTGLTDCYGEEFDRLYYRYVQEGKYIKKVSAQELYRKIMESQMETGMPYMMFKDHCNEKSNQKNLGTIKNSNLCVAPETKILTDRGYFAISELEDKFVEVWNGECFSRVIVKKTGLNKKLIRVKLSNQHIIDCTPYHKFYIENMHKEVKVIEASNLKEGMKLINFEFPILDLGTYNDIKNPYVVGIYAGTSTDTKQIKINSLNTEILNHIQSEYKDLVVKTDDEIVIGLQEEINKYYVPINSSIKCKLEWLSGLCDVIGRVIARFDKKIIQISSENLEFLKDISLMLNTVGIIPEIDLLIESNKMILLNDLKNTYDYQKIYGLLIDTNNLYKLNELGLKTFRLDTTCEKPSMELPKFIVIKSVKDLNRSDDTYCFNEPVRHMGIFNGVITGNCSEIVQKSTPEEVAVCNLASICLPKFVETTGKFNFESLGKVVEVAVNNLNNIIDLNYYPIPETSRSNFAHRPVGLGVQGLADCYFKMGYSFDSEEAFKLNKQIFECIYYHSLKKSNELAKEKGHYNSFHESPFSQGKLQFHLAGKNINDLDKELAYSWDTLIEDIKRYGTRNSLLTTVMPTASTAQIMNNNESIEPYASNMYVRKVLAGEYNIVNKHLVEDLKKLGLWTKELYYEMLYDNGSVQKLSVPEEIKQKYKTAYELKQSVIIKQAVERGIFIDQSQSLNIFMATPDFNKLYSAHMYGWKNGIKTGSYYIRSQPVTEAIKFSIDIDVINNIKTKRGIINKENNKTKYITQNDVCESCSA
jgi:ribonucleoside-diphosphate reductase alpha chain